MERHAGGNDMFRHLVEKGNKRGCAEE